LCIQYNWLTIVAIASIDVVIVVSVVGIVVALHYVKGNRIVGGLPVCPGHAVSYNFKCSANYEYVCELPMGCNCLNNLSLKQKQLDAIVAHSVCRQLTICFTE